MARQKVIDENGYLISNSQQRRKIHKKEKTVKLIACGDTGPVRKLESLVLEKGPDSVLGDISEILCTGDIVFANLEAPYSTRGTPINRIPTFRLHPDAFSIIKRSNINVVSLANNHIFDYGLYAFNDTISLIRANGIAYFGAGKTEAEALKPAVLSVKGICFGFLGFIDIDSKIKNFPRGITPPGIVPQMHYERVKKAIRGLRSKVDWLILSLHFGWEYQLYPSPKDVALCRKFIDEGADLVLGHHPHYPQGIEQYKNGLIAYSLGNFVWDQNFVGHTSSGFILEVELTKKKIQSVKLVPFALNPNYEFEISENIESINHLNEISSVLLNKQTLNEKWYFVCRNKFLELCMNLKEIVFGDKFNAYSIMTWFRSILSPRSIYTWKSLFIFILSFRALSYEIRRKHKKLRLQR